MLPQRSLLHWPAPVRLQRRSCRRQWFRFVENLLQPQQNIIHPLWQPKNRCASGSLYSGLWFPGRLLFCPRRLGPRRTKFKRETPFPLGSPDSTHIQNAPGSGLRIPCPRLYQIQNAPGSGLWPSKSTISLIYPLSSTICLLWPLARNWQFAGIGRNCPILDSVEIAVSLNNMHTLLSATKNATSSRFLTLSNPSATPTLVTMIDLGFSIICAFLEAWNQSATKQRPLETKRRIKRCPAKMKKNVKVRNILFWDWHDNIRVGERDNMQRLYLYEIFLDYFTIMVIITSFEEFDSTKNLYQVPLSDTKVPSI